MKGIIRFFANVFKPKYTYSLQKIPPVKENGFYMLKETGSHSCIQAKADEILNTDFIYNIDPHDIMYIIKFEEAEAMESRKYKIIEERRGFLSRYKMPTQKK